MQPFELSSTLTSRPSMQLTSPHARSGGAKPYPGIGVSPKPKDGPIEGVPWRGDIVWVDLNPARGTEIRKIRPAVVISNDSCNRYGTRVVVLPITGNVDSLYPGETLVQVKGRTASWVIKSVRWISPAWARRSES
jgi:PemK-like, MazF-like toxin of type II toxin-antitoxin system